MDTIKWNGDSISVLDQRLLPDEEVYVDYASYKGMINSIRDMVVRGAPAIGIAAAMGIALAAKKMKAKSFTDYKNELNAVCDEFIAARPTAVNLQWAVEKMRGIMNASPDISAAERNLEKAAESILAEDIQTNKKIGENGSRLLEDGDVVMTHCNAGALATGGYGTALGVIRSAVKQGKKITVFACETRPFLQGSRLTAWELMKDGIPVTLITDSMSGHFMRTGVIKKVIVGADRIAINGDTANKIGTYSHAVIARENNVPFYVAAPVSTIDRNSKTGDEIVIEERPVDEVAYIRGVQVAPEGVSIRNPAFDVTPVKYISAIVTERGVLENPSFGGLKEILSFS